MGLRRNPRDSASPSNVNKMVEARLGSPLAGLYREDSPSVGFMALAASPLIWRGKLAHLGPSRLLLSCPHALPHLCCLNNASSSPPAGPESLPPPTHKPCTNGEPSRLFAGCPKGSCCISLECPPAGLPTQPGFHEKGSVSSSRSMLVFPVLGTGPETPWVSPRQLVGG